MNPGEPQPASYPGKIWAPFVGFTCMPVGITSESFVCTVSVRSAPLRVGLGRKGDANRLNQKQSEVPEFQTHLLS